jgi:hypothetical protein
MALLIKNQHRPTASSIQPTVLDQWQKVSQPAVALPASTTGQLFRVKGGRVLVRSLIGQVTTAIQATDPVLKVSSKALDTASAAVGTAVDVASTVDISSLEVGGLLFVEGDGTAIVKSNAGAAFIGTNSGQWIAPQGEIYLTTGATKTGAIKWDIWYQPIDPGAYVEAAPLTSSLLTAAI